MKSRSEQDLRALLATTTRVVDVRTREVPPARMPRELLRIKPAL